MAQGGAGGAAYRGGTSGPGVELKQEDQMGLYVNSVTMYGIKLTFDECVNVLKRHGVTPCEDDSDEVFDAVCHLPGVMQIMYAARTCEDDDGEYDGIFGPRFDWGDDPNPLTQAHIDALDTFIQVVGPDSEGQMRRAKWWVYTEVH